MPPAKMSLLLLLLVVVDGMINDHNSGKTPQPFSGPSLFQIDGVDDVGG
jgi:hypothetical protein